MVSVISFDMGCTLFWEKGCIEGWLDYSLKRTSKALARVLVNEGYNVSEEEIYSILLDIAKNQLDKNPEKELWHLHRMHILLSSLEIIPRPRLVEKVYRAYIDDVVSDLVFEEKYRDLLKYLKDKGYTIVLSTDTGSHEIPLRLISKAGIEEYIDIIISSQLIGYTKASPKFYNHLLKIVGVKPSEVVHVGDNIQRDYEIPIKLGFKAILYRKLGCSDSDPKPCIDNLYEIIELI